MIGTMLAAGATLGAQSGPQPSSHYQYPGTRRMAERLERMTGEVSPEVNPFANAERVARARERLAKATSPQEMVDLQLTLAINLLNGGQSEAAAEAFRRMQDLLSQYDMRSAVKNRRVLRQYIAVSLLRMGEQENCLTNHTAASCLLPIRPEGVHRLQRGSLGAIEVLSEQLKEFPDDLNARWLINIAYMTLGKYPEQVPKAWLIDPKVFASDHDIGRFQDVAPGLGLDVDDLAGGGHRRRF